MRKAAESKEMSLLLLSWLRHVFSRSLSCLICKTGISLSPLQMLIASTSLKCVASRLSSLLSNWIPTWFYKLATWPTPSGRPRLV